jgi:Putative DNA-binding domain
MRGLLELQRRMAEAVMQPLTCTENMRKRNSRHQPMTEVASSFIAPNDRLTSFERLEIYNRQYWFRLMDALSEDFPGLRVILGGERFRAMAKAYLTDCPSRSFTLRNLGSCLTLWLGSHPEWLQPNDRLARDMTNLEWAHIEAFDAADLPALTPEDLASEGPPPQLILQPYITLLELEYPVDNILLAVRKRQRFYITSAGDGRRVPIKHPVPAAVFLAVHRADFSVHYKRLGQEAYLLLSGIQDGLSLPDALDFAFADSGIAEEVQAHRIEQWFRTWMSLGWFCKSNTKKDW